MKRRFSAEKKCDDATIGDVDFDPETTKSRRIVRLSSEIDRARARGALAVQMRISAVDVDDLASGMA